MATHEPPSRQLKQRLQNVGAGGPPKLGFIYPACTAIPTRVPWTLNEFSKAGSVILPAIDYRFYPPQVLPIIKAI